MKASKNILRRAMAGLKQIRRYLVEMGRWLKLHDYILSLLQTFMAVAAIIIASYALYRDGVSDNESSKRFEKSTRQDSVQHQEAMNIYGIEKSLMELYVKHAESMLDQLEEQSKIAEQQYDSQVLLNKPGIITKDIQLTDTLGSNLSKDGAAAIMPELVFQAYNYGHRIAKEVIVKIDFLSPKSGFVYHASNKSQSIEPLAEQTQRYFPIILKEDASSFFSRIAITWKDEINSKPDSLIRFVNWLRKSDSTYFHYLVKEEFIPLINNSINNSKKNSFETTIDREYRWFKYKR